MDRGRNKQGNYPFFLATNHFCGEGPLVLGDPAARQDQPRPGLRQVRHRTSKTSTARKMLDYACSSGRCFARDLPHRKVVDEGRYFDYSYDAVQTISPQNDGP